MCTATLLRGPRGLILVMNRDERRDRAAERAPSRHSRGRGPCWIAPLDGERGGTWIGVSELGLTACLLNGYVNEDLELLGREGVPSRGELIPALFARTSGDAWRWLDEDLDPSPYPSFTLLVADRDRAGLLCWRRNGKREHRSIEDECFMVSSSFWRTDEVLAYRRGLFDRWRQGGRVFHGLIPAFHLDSPPGRQAWTPFMSRPFSATRSITRVDLDATGARLRWWRRGEEGPLDPARPEVDDHLEPAPPPGEPGR